MIKEKTLIKCIVTKIVTGTFDFEKYCKFGNKFYGVKLYCEPFYSMGMKWGYDIYFYRASGVRVYITYEKLSRNIMVQGMPIKIKFDIDIEYGDDIYSHD